MFGTSNYAYGYPYSAPSTAAPQQQSNGIVWVQGEAGAKSFLVAPGQSVLLMDSENSVFYIKSSDPSGMPMPLRTFDYTERTVKQESPTSDFVTREEFEKRIKEITDAKQFVRSTEQKPKYQQKHD